MADAVIDLAGLARLRETRKRHENVCVIDTFGCVVLSQVDWFLWSEGKVDTA
jgi:hypothetical protein